MAGRRRGRIAAAVGTAGVVGLGLLVVAGSAYAQPQLPPVTPEDLVSSVLAAADPGPFNGTVELDNNLGLPALPDAPQAANGTSTARIWSGGNNLGRVALPTDSGERTLVSDGTTDWAWNSDDRTVVKRPAGDRRDQSAATDPTAAAAKAIGELRTTSTIAVDGTATVAGRSAYELVLTPRPHRAHAAPRGARGRRRREADAPAADRARHRLHRAGPAGRFHRARVRPQDAKLFAFTPPPGATVTDAPARDTSEPSGEHDGRRRWHRPVKIDPRRPADATPGRRHRPTGPTCSSIGTPVSGTWGSGRLVTTAVGSAIITGDGRIAAGAVPEQVLTDALSK